MSFLKSVFGNKKPTSTDAQAKLADEQAVLDAIPVQINEIQRRLSDVASLSDERHAALDAELLALGRARTRSQARIAQLQTALEQITRDEGNAALKRDAVAVQKRVDIEAPKLLRQYEERAAELAVILGGLSSIQQGADQVNRRIATARKSHPNGEHPELVVGVSKHLSEPEITEPDQVVFEDVWEAPDAMTGEFRPAGVMTVVDGVTRSNHPMARLVKRERIIPGRRRKGRSIALPNFGTQLPAVRLGASPFWPRSK